MIVDSYRHPEREVAGFSRLVPIEELRQNGSNLSIALYIRQAQATSETVNSLGNKSGIGLVQAIKDWQASSAELRQSMSNCLQALDETGIAKRTEGRAG